MWPPNRPRELLHKKYDFDLSDAWRERVQKAPVALRVVFGADGLVKELTGS
jgi:hypothetical protein